MTLGMFTACNVLKQLGDCWPECMAAGSEGKIKIKAKDEYLYPVISGLAEAEQMKRTLAPSVTV